MADDVDAWAWAAEVPLNPGEWLGGSVDGWADYMLHDLDTEADVAEEARTMAILYPDGRRVPAPTTLAGWRMLAELLPDEGPEPVVVLWHDEEEVPNE